MDGIYFVLVGLALFGLLPLAVILIKKRRADNILASGLTTMATVEHIYRSARMTHEVVHYQFRDLSGQSYTGRLTTKLGHYKPGDTLEIYYLQDRPRRNTIKGAWGSKFFMVFGIVIALVVWFMVYKLYEMVRDGQM